jgi:hypothetical protein
MSEISPTKYEITFINFNVEIHGEQIPIGFKDRPMQTFEVSDSDTDLSIAFDAISVVLGGDAETVDHEPSEALAGLRKFGGQVHLQVRIEMRFYPDQFQGPGGPDALRHQAVTVTVVAVTGPDGQRSIEEGVLEAHNPVRMANYSVKIVRVTNERRVVNYILNCPLPRSRTLIPLIPVRRDKGDRYPNGYLFVDPEKVRPRPIMLGWVPFETAPLRFGQMYSLLGVSQTDVLVEQGVVDVTDSIDPAVNLHRIYVDVAGEVVVFTVHSMASSSFAFDTLANYRELQLDFTAQDLFLEADTLTYDGRSLTTFVPVTLETKLQLKIQVGGRLNIESGDLRLMAHPVEMTLGEKVIDQRRPRFIAYDPEEVEVNGWAVPAIELLGYDLLAYRVRYNRP